MQKRLTEDEQQDLVRWWQKAGHFDEFLTRVAEWRPGFFRTRQHASKWANGLRRKGVPLKDFKWCKGYNVQKLVEIASELAKPE